jgi:hypothetical protein
MSRDEELTAHQDLVGIDHFLQPGALIVMTFAIVVESNRDAGRRLGLEAQSMNASRCSKKDRVHFTKASNLYDA